MATSTALPRERESAEWEPGRDQNRIQVVASILFPVGWLCFTLLYVGFWASGFSLFQSVIVILVSTLVLGGVMGAVWTFWAPPRTTPTP